MATRIPEVSEEEAREYARRLGWDYDEIPEWMSGFTAGKLTGTGHTNFYLALHREVLPARRLTMPDGRTVRLLHKNDVIRRHYFGRSPHPREVRRLYEDQPMPRPTPRARRT